MHSVHGSACSWIMQAIEATCGVHLECGVRSPATQQRYTELKFGIVITIRHVHGKGTEVKQECRNTTVCAACSENVTRWIYLVLH